MDIFCNISYSNISEQIIETKYTEGIKNDILVDKPIKTIDRYNILLDCILSIHDIEYIHSDNKDFYRDQELVRIATLIDEDSDKYYNNYNYKKLFSKKIIQQGLMKYNSLSSILYLVDYYKSNIVIFDKSKCEYILIGGKYDKYDFYELSDNNWKSLEDIDKSEIIKIGLTILNVTHTYFNNDIKSYLIYETELNAISNYTVGELRELLSNKNIDIKKNGQNKTKKELYEELYMILVHINIK
jgi:hypothetical protein